MQQLTRRRDNVQTRKEACSADQISLETDDPVAHPLPDLRLFGDAVVFESRGSNERSY